MAFSRGFDVVRTCCHPLPKTKSKTARALLVDECFPGGVSRSFLLPIRVTHRVRSRPQEKAGGRPRRRFARDVGPPRLCLSLSSRASTGGDQLSEVRPLRRALRSLVRRRCTWWPV